MYISLLSLLNFKNYNEIALELHPKVNCFVGNNGVGKTNLLDSVYYLCMCKSYFHNTDQYIIRTGADFMVLQGVFEHKGDTSEIYCGLKPGKRKIFRKNKKEYNKLSDHIGQFPVVMVSPADSALITEGSEERRKYMNAVISQYNPSYLDDVMLYNRILAQRNKLLKDMARIPGAEELLQVYDSQLFPLGTRIHEIRAGFINKLVPVFKEFYKSISQGNEEVEIEYTSQLNTNSFENLLIETRKIDLASQYTNAGIHKDDLELIMEGSPIRRTGSQGQQKTFLVALKFAQFSFLKDLKAFAPILLLDDIFDKFDVNRVSSILNLVADESFGQIFITHTNEGRMRELLGNFPGNFSLFRVDKDNISLAK